MSQDGSILQERRPRNEIGFLKKEMEQAELVMTRAKRALDHATAAHDSAKATYEEAKTAFESAVEEVG